jgi:glutamate-1-semialdehyde 2,1-aminomutase
MPSNSAATTGAGARTVSCADSLGEALTAAKARYALRRPASRAEWHSAARVMPGGNTRTILYFDPFPICMAGGSGCTLVDVDGIRYVDLLGEYTAGIYGHSNAVIAAAVTEALHNGLNLSAHNRAEIRLASLICTRYPSIELVRFTNSGTEANLLALATAAAFTGRDRMLVFEGAYH